MSSVTVGILREAKRLVRRSGLRRPLEALGLVGLGRRLYNHAVLSDRVHRTTLLGTPLAFAVETDLDITLIDAPGIDDEEESIRQLLDALQPGDLVLDVGAHLGVISMLVGARGRDRSVRVLAFEPDSVIAERVRRSAALNGLENVEVVAVALGDRDGTISLRLERERGGNRSGMVTGAESGETSIEAPVRRGEAVLRERGETPSILKIDIEGAEHMALRGLESFLVPGGVREIFIEVHPEPLRALGSSSDELLAWLNERGYEKIWERPRRTEVHWRLRRKDAAEVA